MCYLSTCALFVTSRHSPAASCTGPFEASRTRTKLRPTRAATTARCSSPAPHSAVVKHRCSRAHAVAVHRACPSRMLHSEPRGHIRNQKRKKAQNHAETRGGNTHAQDAVATAAADLPVLRNPAEPSMCARNMRPQWAVSSGGVVTGWMTRGYVNPTALQ